MFLRTLKRVPKEKPAEEGVIPHGMQSSFFTSFLIVSNYIDKILLFYFINPAALALFVAAERVSDLLKTAVQDMASALAPKFAKTKNYTEKLDKFFKILCIAFGAGLVIFAFTFLPYLILLIYGEKYADAIPYSQALMCAAALGNLASIQFRFIRSKLDTKNFRDIVVGTSLFRIVISAILIPLFGLKGAVISAFIYRIAMSVSINYVMRKDYLKKPANFLPISQSR
jgi:O-antigen/teichoic acid export membrane protein